MKRRVNLTLQITTIDSPHGLLSAHDGAVIVYFGRDSGAYEVQLEGDALDIHARPKVRKLRGKPFLCAVFAKVRPGAWVARCPWSKREEVIEVRARELAQVDWRR